MNDTPYYQARLRAAERDTTFESRQSTSAVVGIGSTRLYQIERGLRLPHEDEVIVMAKEYGAGTHRVLLQARVRHQRVLQEQEE